MRNYFLLFAMMCLGTVAWSNTHTFSTSDSARIDLNADSLLICLGTSIELSSTDADAYAWRPNIEITDTTSQTVTITPTSSRWYYLKATVGAGECLDSVFLSVIDPSFEVIVSTTDTVCPEERVDITFDASAPISSVTWDPADGVVRPEDVNGTPIRPLRTTEYVVTVQIGNCELSDTFTIDVVPFEVNVTNGDTLFLCKPDTGVIVLNVIPNGNPVQWTPMDGFIDPNVSGSTADVNPSVTTVYTATSSFMGCTLERSVVVKVDSLPDLRPLTALPFKDPYCAGDTFWIIGPAVDTALYPDLTWSWQPMDGQIIGPEPLRETGNVRIRIQDTTMFIRTATNNACEDTSTITVNAIPPEIPLSLTDTMACPGEQFQVEVLDPDIMDLEWTPETGLSCTMCPDPTVTVQDSAITYSVTGNKEDCPVTGSLQVEPMPFFTLVTDPPNAIGCEGDQIEVTILNSEFLSNIVITVSGDGLVSCTDCSNPVVTINGSGFINISADVPDSLGCGAFGQIIYGEGNPQQLTETLPICPGVPTAFDLSVYGDEVQTNGIATCDGTDCIVTVGQGGGSLTVLSDVSNPGFCGTETTVQFIPFPPDAAMIMTQDTGDIGQGEIITVELDPPGPAGTTYEWYVNGVLQNDDGNPAMVTMPTMGNSAQVTVVWTNSQGCEQMASVDYELVEPDIKFPNAFTPGPSRSGEDVNDYFRPYVAGPAELEEMLIFNRWGHVVYEGSDPQGWDGTYKGEPAPAEVYVYLAKFRFPNGDRLEYKGDLTLLR